MNQELMTLDFWQDTVIYESKTFPVGTLACDALNVPVNTIAKINEQCEKINLLLGILNAGQDASALCPIAKEAALTMLDILSQTPPFSYMNISKHRERIEKVFTVDNALKYVEFAIKAATNSLQFEEIQNFADAMMLQRYTAVFGHLAYSLGEYQTAMLDFAEKNRRQRSRPHRRGFCKNVRQLFPAGVFHHGRQCLDVYPEQFRSVCIRHPSRRKSCEAGQADALCILCRDVPV